MRLIFVAPQLESSLFSEENVDKKFNGRIRVGQHNCTEEKKKKKSKKKSTEETRSVESSEPMKNSKKKATNKKKRKKKKKIACEVFSEQNRSWKQFDEEQIDRIIDLEVAANHVKEWIEKLIVKSIVYNKAKEDAADELSENLFTQASLVLRSNLMEARSVQKDLQNFVIFCKKEFMHSFSVQSSIFVEGLAKILEKLSRVGDALAFLEAGLEVLEYVSCEYLLTTFANVEAEICKLSLHDGAHFGESHFESGDVEMKMRLLTPSTHRKLTIPLIFLTLPETHHYFFF
ncbi:unnamed protein product [Caenorhabditis auriculariae]|uniref:Uncharacterized protein n=1 Tax=Caenorhabditis auriculariae TaxID=2777116 RepID=A0A8S1HTR6_9PELO|nr:unnamed protein product [Caenorhabditis auriculariae]